MKTAYLDCIFGVAGDMILGALVVGIDISFLCFFGRDDLYP